MTKVNMIKLKFWFLLKNPKLQKLKPSWPGKAACSPRLA